MHLVDIFDGEGGRTLLTYTSVKLVKDIMNKAAKLAKIDGVLDQKSEILELTYAIKFYVELKPKPEHVAAVRGYPLLFVEEFNDEGMDIAFGTFSFMPPDAFRMVCMYDDLRYESRTYYDMAFKFMQKNLFRTIDEAYSSLPDGESS